MLTRLDHTGVGAGLTWTDFEWGQEGPVLQTSDGATRRPKSACCRPEPPCGSPPLGHPQRALNPHWDAESVGLGRLTPLWQGRLPGWACSTFTVLCWQELYTGVLIFWMFPQPSGGNLRENLEYSYRLSQRPASINRLWSYSWMTFSPIQRSPVNTRAEEPGIVKELKPEAPSDTKDNGEIYLQL